MKIIFNNKANVSNKYLRFIKWKLYGLRNKFKHLIYVEVFLDKEGQQVPEYSMQVRLGISGHDLIIKRRSPNIWKVINLVSRDAHLQLARKKRTY